VSSSDLTPDELGLLAAALDFYMSEYLDPAELEEQYEAAEALREKLA
jgi:hypothetical protein